MEEDDEIKIIHCGCANRYYDGYINCDKMTEWKGKKYRLDECWNLGEKWPHDVASIDGIVGMAVFQQLQWRELIVCFREAYRVLKVGGILRMGVPLLENGKELEWNLGWNNINLFTYELLERVLLKVGFSRCRMYNAHQGEMEKLHKLDNRTDHQFFIEAVK